MPDRPGPGQNFVFCKPEPRLTQPSGPKYKPESGPMFKTDPMCKPGPTRDFWAGSGQAIWAGLPMPRSTHSVIPETDLANCPMQQELHDCHLRELPCNIQRPAIIGDAFLTIS